MNESMTRAVEAAAKCHSAIHEAVSSRGKAEPLTWGEHIEALVGARVLIESVGELAGQACAELGKCGSMSDFVIKMAEVRDEAGKLSRRLSEIEEVHGASGRKVQQFNEKAAERVRQAERDLEEIQKHVDAVYRLWVDAPTRRHAR